MLITVQNKTKGTLLGERVEVADTFVSRLVGLLGRRRLEQGGGLLIHPSTGVHTIGMLFPIDVLFLDRAHKVIGIRHSMMPFLMTRFFLRAECALELPARTARQSGTEVGDELSFDFA